ncbi:hypothetical protein MMC13_004679 [Lambiella insularis]|nr:hypothetical protein [Lambiella insularis]
MIAATEIAELNVNVPCEEASELVVVVLETGERGVTRVIELPAGVADEIETLEGEEEDKAEVGNGLELTVEVGTLELGVEDGMTEEVEATLVADAVLLVAVTCGIAVGTNVLEIVV